MRAPHLLKSSELFSKISEFDTIIDVRSPSEYLEDHLPNSINLPVLSDNERHLVGLTHKQDGAFAGSRLGAPLVSRNIANHIETILADRPKTWKPLVYCWRGGQRSGAMATVLARVGWHTNILEGGYRAYRQLILADLSADLGHLDFRIIAGRTGSAKSLLLQTLAEQGAQVLDLESLAQHKGSVLGDVPNRPQPSQRFFETMLAEQLRGFDRARPIFVESESKKVGRVHVPDVLMAAMRSAPVITVSANLDWRVNFLLEDYQYFVQNSDRLFTQLDCLTPLHGEQKINSWKALAQNGKWFEFVRTMLTQHYDPAYDRAIAKNFKNNEKNLPDVTLEGFDFKAACIQAAHSILN